MQTYIVRTHGHYFDVVRRETDQPIDTLRTLAGAEYACSILNQGEAAIMPHALLGCRIVVAAKTGEAA